MASSYDQQQHFATSTSQAQGYNYQSQSQYQQDNYAQYQQPPQNYFEPVSPTQTSSQAQAQYNTQYNTQYNAQYTQQQQPQAQQSPRPQQSPTTSTDHQRKRSRGFSLTSDKSGSRKSGQFHESHAEKENRRLHSKADPTLAMNEAEPAAVAAMQASMPSLRSIQHKDPYGNLIVDPDLSNPTRSRWERPLDTIRSFEAAIDGNYSLRTYTNPSPDTWNKRASVYSTTPRDSYRGPNNYSDSRGQRPRNQNAGFRSYDTSGSNTSGEPGGYQNGENNYSLNYTPQAAPQARSAAAVTPVAAPPPEEKRKSWFKKKFRK